MAELINLSQNLKIASDVEVARSFASRLKGLLGRESLADNQALWIHRCSSIHTWFMNFPIDVVFVDKQVRVVKIVENIEPFRLLWPTWGADSVFELAAGVLEKTHRPQKGDQLHVRA